jgi:hypothetical protein
MRSFASQASRQTGPAAQLSWTAPALRNVRTAARGHASSAGKSAEAARQELQTTPDLPFLHDFGRIAIHATPPAIPPKLRVGASGDAHEREADQVAEQVMRMPEPRPRTGPRPPDDGGHVEAPATVLDVLRSPGHPLDASTRAFLEPRFGHDFSHVRVHADASAGNAASAIDARAFTAGSHVVFGAAEYAPQTEGGRHLLAHELTHVVQQRSPAADTPVRRKRKGTEPDPAKGRDEVETLLAPYRAKTYAAGGAEDEYGPEARKDFTDIRRSLSAEGEKYLRSEAGRTLLEALHGQPPGHALRLFATSWGAIESAREEKDGARQVHLMIAPLISQSYAGTSAAAKEGEGATASASDTFAAYDPQAVKDCFAIVRQLTPEALEYLRSEGGAVLLQTMKKKPEGHALWLFAHYWRTAEPVMTRQEWKEIGQRERMRTHWATSLVPRRSTR